MNARKIKAIESFDDVRLFNRLFDGVPSDPHTIEALKSLVMSGEGMPLGRHADILDFSLLEKAKILNEILKRCLRDPLKERPFLKSPEDLLDYCRLSIGGREQECFMGFFLGHNLRLIEDRVLWTGTIDHVPAYPRELVKACLAFNASAMILAHNHPSGDIRPSQADINLTSSLQKTFDVMQIRFIDHIIIGKGEKFFSFAREGYLASNAHAPHKNL